MTVPAFFTISLKEADTAIMTPTVEIGNAVIRARLTVHLLVFESILGVVLVTLTAIFGSKGIRTLLILHATRQ